MRVATKLALGFGSLLVMLCIVAVTGWHALSDAEEQLNDIVNDNMVKIALVNDASYSLNA